MTQSVLVLVRYRTPPDDPAPLGIYHFTVLYQSRLYEYLGFTPPRHRLLHGPNSTPSQVGQVIKSPRASIRCPARAPPIGWPGPGARTKTPTCLCSWLAELAGSCKSKNSHADSCPAHVSPFIIRTQGPKG